MVLSWKSKPVFERLEHITGAQLSRDILAGLFLLVMIWAYLFGLDQYLIGLSNPLPMKIVLLTSLFVSFLYDVKAGISRESGAALVTTSIIFCAASYLAFEYRAVYLSLIDDFKSVDELKEAVGQEYVRAVSNPAVGIGACFAAAVATLRLPFQKIIYEKIHVVLLKKRSNEICEHCGQLLKNS